jgi:hypothetical protein
VCVEEFRYVEAPEEYAGPGPSLFLAGGITHCPDWQAEAIGLLTGVPATILNPRRHDFDVTAEDIAEQQIRWEYRHLQRASVVLFWFSEGPSPQPIALYELGAAAAVERPIAVGAHPDYRRRNDVLVQLSLSRPDLTVHDDLASTVAAAIGALTARPPGAGRR